VRLSSKKKRSLSSQRWLARQMKDPFVKKATEAGLRSRAAFKLMEMDDKFKFFERGQVVVDLGAAPGSWSQVAIDRMGGDGTVIAIDLIAMDPLGGVTCYQGDFLAEETDKYLKKTLLDKPVDVVLSDMAPATTGHKSTDHARIMTLAEASLDFARDVLGEGGVFVVKLFQGGGDPAYLKEVRRLFASVSVMKPAASRKESSEVYVVARGFRGVKTPVPPTA
jgi:23S rRNA (uridine2552-2'-O)-methyltransferase